MKYQLTIMGGMPLGVFLLVLVQYWLCAQLNPPKAFPVANIQNTTRHKSTRPILDVLFYRYLNRTPERAPGDSYSGKKGEGGKVGAKLRQQ